MNTHNICFRGEIRKILSGYPLLSVAMHFMQIVSYLPEKIFQIVSFTPHAKCNVQNKTVHPDQCPIPGVWSVSLLII